MCVCVRGVCDGVCSFIPLRLELQAKADLVAASVDVLAVEESRQRQLDSCRNTHVRVRITLLYSSPSTRSLTTGVQLMPTEVAHLA